MAGRRSPSGPRGASVPAAPPWRRVRRAGRPLDAPLRLDLVGGLEALGPSPPAPCGSCRPARPTAARPAPRPPPPARGPVDVDADHGSRARLLVEATRAAGDTTPDGPRSGRNRANGTRRPATEASSKLIPWIACRHHRGSAASVPDARRARRGRRGEIWGPADLMPSADPLGRPNREISAAQTSSAPSSTPPPSDCPRPCVGLCGGGAR